ncbi:serine-rich coiled-coil domain-containing protein 2 isoform X3 [Rhinatrema bivittatum]|uniref:serine-rich coiled-coil domain-containing protein 2 isoform X3 n=1 Tax=Rhinatrema bivittatum TaxID=194408 RepID=UPI00112ACA4E|nr:serine-rich coiled-coil domain-containing protein 2 isoform X3 [Rhinatrema bivittatum]
MEEKIRARTSLSSKLPKFGRIKSEERLLKTMPNAPAASLQGSSNSKTYNKHSGIAHMPSVSLNWRKSQRPQQNDQNPDGPPLYFIDKVDDAKNSQSQGAGNKDASKVTLKSSSLLSSKPTKQTNMLVSPLEDLNPKSLSGLSNSAKFTKGSFLRRTAYSGLNAAKSHVNGFYTNLSNTGLQRPRANSSTSRNSSKESLMQPTASMKSLSCESIVRSQSFSHSIQSSLLPTTSLTRSYSFNRAVDLTRPPQNQHISSRTSERSNLQSRSARQSEIPNGIEPHIKSGFTRTYAGSSLKKPGLSNGSGIAAPLGYRMGRPSLLKSNKPLFSGEIVVDVGTDFATDSCTVGKAQSLSSNTREAIDKQKELVETSRQVGNYTVCGDVDKTDAKLRSLSDDVDEISISSLSSSDKNELSEDFSDDFIDLGDQNQTLHVQPVETSLRKDPFKSDASLSFKSLAENNISRCKTDAWVDLNLSSVQSKNENTEDSFGNRQISPDMNYREGSSLELSPSDSSDGTYMWDEEGMEPIGSVHPCGSYDSSEMNSLDILNNIDSCDLEDDDLMLDVDLPEDTLYDNVDSSTMSHFERPDRNVRQQQPELWKRAPHRWSGKEHYHLGNADHYHNGKNNLNRGSAYLEPPPGPVESYGMAQFYQSPRSKQIGLHENTVMLDEMTLLHMVQDCTSVKTQLLKLKRLMQESDEAESLQDIRLSVPPSPEPQEAEPVYKADDLLNEIRLLKEEAKKKDERIKQLEHQITTRCKCHRESPDVKGGRHTHFDKYTQTSWRRSSHPVLQCSSNTLGSTDHTQGILIKTAHIEDHNKHTDQVLHESKYHQKQKFVNCAENDPFGLSDLLSTQLKIKDLEEDVPPAENQKIEKNPIKSGEQTYNELLDIQTSPSSIQITTLNSTITEPQANSAVKGQASMIGPASRMKTSYLFKSKGQNTLTCHTKTCSVSSQSSQDNNDQQLYFPDPSPLLQVTADNLSQRQSPVAIQLPLHSLDNSSSALQPTIPNLLRLQAPATSPSQLQAPAASPSQLQAPAASPSQLQAPAASPSQLQAPAASPSQLQAPAASPLQLQAPAASLSQLQAPAATPSQLQAPAATPSQLQAPAASPSQLQAPAASPSQLQAPAASLSQLQAPAASLSQLQVPAASLSQLQAPAASLSLLQTPAASPSLLQTPAASPRLQVSAASPSRLQTPAASPSRLQASAASPSRLQASVASPSRLQASVARSPRLQASVARSPRLQTPATSPSQLRRPATSPSQKSIQSPKTSKLRPPNALLSKSKQMSFLIPSTAVPQESQNVSSKAATSKVSKSQPQKKESMQQSQSNSLYVGEKTASNRHSRLPKPKTH